MNTVILIPARYQSSRYPGKPLVELKGAFGSRKPLIQRSVEAARRVSGVSGIFVVTDDERIAEGCLALELSKEDFRYLIAVVCVLRGHEGLGELLVHLHTISGSCPKCGESVYPQEIRDSGY